MKLLKGVCPLKHLFTKTSVIMSKEGVDDFFLAQRRPHESVVCLTISPKTTENINEARTVR